MNDDAILSLRAAARGLVEAMKAKGYETPRVVFQISDSDTPFCLAYATDDTYVCARRDTRDEIVSDMLAMIERMPPAEPLLAATLGLVEVAPGLWREAA